MANRTGSGFTNILIIFLLVIAIMIVVPAIFLANESPQNQTFTHEENEGLTLKGNIQAIVTNIDGNEINGTVYNEASGNSRSFSNLGEGNTTQLNFQDYTISVTYDDRVNSNTVIVSYEYPLYIDWPTGASMIVRYLPLILVALTVFMIIALAVVSIKIKEDS